MMLITVKVLRNNHLTFDGRYLVPVPMYISMFVCIHITSYNSANIGKKLTVYQVVQYS